MVSNAVYRKAIEIVNRGHVWNEGNNTFTVHRQDTGTTRTVVISPTIDGRRRFVSNGKYHQETGRNDTYITAVKIAMGLPVTVEA